MSSVRPLAGFVLAGGRSSRMGRDKSLVELQGKPLMERAVERMRTVADSVHIVGDRPDLACFAPVIPDRMSGVGPLAGLQAALAATESDWNIFLPVDLPLLPAEFLRWLVDRVERTGALATLPVVAGVPQPLVAVYHRGLLRGMEKCLEAANFKTIRAIAAAAEGADGSAPRQDFFSVETVAAAGHFSGIENDLPACVWFHNANTPLDLDTCISWLE